MFEKVNPSHPDKVADRIAGALVDMAYAKEENPRIAVEVLIGHGVCHIIAETSVALDLKEIEKAVCRISGKDPKDIDIDYMEVPQDPHLADAQEPGICCGDNGIFRGCPVTAEEQALTSIARWIYDRHPSDGKYLIDSDAEGLNLTVCQSNVVAEELEEEIRQKWEVDLLEVNPIGDWTGGTDVDTGATNRKLGSDMAEAVTGGGLHGKDLSKADVTVNICLHHLAAQTGRTYERTCAIGDNAVGGMRFADMVEWAREYVREIGGFEKLAEWGLIR